MVYPNVSRVDHGSTHAYVVRLQRQGKESNKSFSDATYGGRRKAKLAAIAWRDQMARLLPAPIPLGVRNGASLKPPGYSYIDRRSLLNQHGGRQDFIVAFLRIENRRHLTTKWSVDKWGPIVARRKCMEWLTRKKAELAARLAQPRRLGAKGATPGLSKASGDKRRTSRPPREFRA